ncbi:unnamed protein product [Linum trigynum]|uniref:CCHC-type domain-containing protein n=1 Tax=Linum trigynum TaxID=586398 RepID=A0AAV2E4B8_9ROSI
MASESDIIDKIASVSLTEEEETSIMIEDSDEEKGIEEVITELGVAGKIISGRLGSARVMKNILKEVWRLKKDFDDRINQEGIMLLRFYCYEDRDRVLLGGPWHYEKQLIVFKEIPPDLQTKEIDFSSTELWTQIRKVPLKLRNNNIATKIGGMFGSFLKWDELHSGQDSNYLRIRVSINIKKLLRRFVKLEGSQGPVSYKVAYEKLPIYCYCCGILGHMKNGCPKKLENPNSEIKEEYGICLRAESPLKRVDLKLKEEKKRMDFLWNELKEGKITKGPRSKKVEQMEKQMEGTVQDPEGRKVVTNMGIEASHEVESSEISTKKLVNELQIISFKESNTQDIEEERTSPQGNRNNESKRE